VLPIHIKHIKHHQIQHVQQVRQKTTKDFGKRVQRFTLRCTIPTPIRGVQHAQILDSVLERLHKVCKLHHPMENRFRLSIFFMLWASMVLSAESECKRDCDLALASYSLTGGDLTYVSKLMKSEVLSKPEDILPYNSETIKNKDQVPAFTRVNVPFPCDCIGDFLGHVFQYDVVSGDTYTSIATNYSDLTTAQLLQSFNTNSQTGVPDTATVNVFVNCSCGNSEVSKAYGLFITYPLRTEDSLQSIANKTGIESDLLLKYNPGVNFSQGSGLVYIPGKGTFLLCYYGSIFHHISYELLTTHASHILGPLLSDQNGAYVPLHQR